MTWRVWRRTCRCRDGGSDSGARARPVATGKRGWALGHAEDWNPVYRAVLWKALLLTA